MKNKKYKINILCMIGEIYMMSLRQTNLTIAKVNRDWHHEIGKDIREPKGIKRP